MSDEWSTGIERAFGPNSHVAALLTSALIARSTHPCGTSADLEAENAVNLYRCVLAAWGEDSKAVAEMAAGAQRQLRHFSGE